MCQYLSKVCPKGRNATRDRSFVFIWFLQCTSGCEMHYIHWQNELHPSGNILHAPRVHARRAKIDILKNKVKNTAIVITAAARHRPTKCIFV